MSHHLKNLTRRHFFENCGVGLGRIGLASAMAGGFPNLLKGAVNNPIAPRDTHFGPKAKRVIFMFMAGAPSQLELFDNKPKLQELDGKPIPPSVIAGQRTHLFSRMLPCLHRGFHLHAMASRELNCRIGFRTLEALLTKLRL